MIFVAASDIQSSLSGASLVAVQQPAAQWLGFRYNARVTDHGKAKGNGKDKASALAKLRERLATLRPKDRIDALLDPKDAQAVVRGFPAEELYQLILDVGLADATEIVQLVTPRQFQTFVDLGAWERDRMNPHRILTWIRAARGEDTEDFMRKVHGLDLEQLFFMLRSFVVVHDLEEDPDVNPQNVTMESPEGKYLLEFLAEGPELAALRALMRDLYTEGPLETARMVESLRWELLSELEETSLQFRDARLGDLGFPPAQEAAALFAFLNPDTVAKVGTATSPGAPGERLAPTGVTQDYVAAMLSGVSSDERETLESELRYVMSAVMVVEGGSPGEPNVLRDMASLTRDTLSLGLEHLTQGRPELAAEAADTHTLKKIFQVGFSLTLRLKHHADRLVREPGVREGNVYLFLRDELAQVAALRLKRPRRWLKVDGAEPVPFRSRRELQEAAAGMARAALQVVVFRALLGTGREAIDSTMAAFAGTIEAVGTDRFLAALVAQAVLDGEVRPAPVPENRLVELGERLFEGDAAAPRLRRSARERAVTALSSKVLPPGVDELPRMVDRTLERFLQEWGTPFLRDERLEPAIVGLHLPLAAST
jgi:hypothetical protein